MSGNRKRLKVSWLARPSETERHAFRSRPDGDTAYRSECGLPTMLDATKNAESKSKCRLCQNALARNFR